MSRWTRSVPTQSESDAMEPGNGKDQGMAARLLDALWRHGPLGTAKRVNTAMSRHFCKIPGCQRLFTSIDSWLQSIHDHLDGRFDRRFGTDTSGHIQLEHLTIEKGSIREGIWYEPMSQKIFMQIMDNISIDYGQFDFIDFGSGKGRVLLLASTYGFRNVVGVEFSKELHEIARKNLALWRQNTGNGAFIRSIHIDASEYQIPDASLVIFLFSPFTGNTMARVVENIKTAFRINQKKIIIIFYGTNQETIDFLKKTNFKWEELTIRADWSKFNKYRVFIFTASPNINVNKKNKLLANMASKALTIRKMTCVCSTRQNQITLL